jgi:hypothetical protein
LQPEPEPEPHHVGAFHATNNDVAQVLASISFLPKLHIEKFRVDITFLIFYYIGQRIEVGAGARTGAASLVRVRHEKNYVDPILAPAQTPFLWPIY